VLFVDRPLPDIRDAISGLAPAATRPLTEGLVWADVPFDDLGVAMGKRTAKNTAEDLRRAAAPNLRMSVPVHGQPNAWHGFGGAEPATRRLPNRTDSTSGGGVLVGVIDTGIRDHHWLRGGYLAAPDDFEPIDVDGNDLLEEQAGHGTFIAGLVLQQAAAASVWVEKALDTEGDGFTASVGEAAIRLASRGVQILNLSLGCFSDDPVFRTAVGHIVTAVHQINPDIVVVAAAGNLAEGKQPQEFWPAALPGVVGVGAVSDGYADDDGYANGNRYAWAPFSNRGDWVDFAAPGEKLVSTYLRHRPHNSKGSRFSGWAEWSGTSFATAVVSGAIARTMSEHNESAKEAVDRLRREAKACTEGEVQVPVIDRVRWG
jgi:subtilisin family serine protease